MLAKELLAFFVVHVDNSADVKFFIQLDYFSANSKPHILPEHHFVTALLELVKRSAFSFYENRHSNDLHIKNSNYTIIYIKKQKSRCTRLVYLLFKLT